MTGPAASGPSLFIRPHLTHPPLAAGDNDHPGLSIAWGACGHVFHLDCIQRWHKTRSACPLCNKECVGGKLWSGARYGLAPRYSMQIIDVDCRILLHLVVVQLGVCQDRKNSAGKLCRRIDAFGPSFFTKRRTCVHWELWAAVCSTLSACNVVQAMCKDAWIAEQEAQRLPFLFTPQDHCQHQQPQCRAHRCRRGSLDDAMICASKK